MALWEVTPLPLLEGGPVVPDRFVTIHEVGSVASVAGLVIALRAYYLYASDRQRGDQVAMDRDLVGMAG